MCKIGDCCLVDPSAEEEECSTASLVVAVSKRQNKSTNVLHFYKHLKNYCFFPGYVSHTHTVGGGSLHKDTMYNCLKLGMSAAEHLNDALIKALKLEESRVGPKRRETVGFLK